MKRVLAFFAIALLAVSMVTAGGSAEADNGQKTITVWAWDDNFNVAVMKEAAEVYATVKPDSGVTVNVESFSKEDVFVKLQTGLAGGGSGLPDIVLLEDYVAGKYLTTFPGAFVELTDYFDFSQFLPFKVDAVSQNGVVYAVPFDTGAAALYYRLDLVEAAGYTEEDMQNLTWDEFIEIGKDVLEATGVPMIAEIANNKTTLVRAIMQSCGEWYFDHDGNIIDTGDAYNSKPVMTSRTANEILSYMETAVKEGTAKKAAVKNVDVRAKTGTAEIINPESGSYEDGTNLASTLAIAGDYIVYFAISAPKGNSVWGADIAAPACGNVIAGLVRQGKIRASDQNVIQLN